MLGILIPAHNEEDLLGQCLQSVQKAASHPGLKGEAVAIVVILDRCTDRSALVASSYNVLCLSTDVGNVGMARALGARHLVGLGARWLASTDADSRVAEDWLVAQLALGADIVCGTVVVEDWGTISEEVQNHYHASYRYTDGHRHIHGANMGFSSDIYLKSGGFHTADAHEDVNFVRACEAVGAKIAWSCAPKVITSARLVSRVHGGFADFLKNLDNYQL